MKTSMQQIIPFNALPDALSTLDNGGRFYNLLTKSDDGNISIEELSKVAGLFSSRQQMVLYYAMSVATLAQDVKQQVDAALTKDAQVAYNRYAPQLLIASEAATKGILASNAIVTGVPKLVETKSDFNGFIIVPIMAGKAMTMILIPIIDKYDIYEMRDDESSETVLIAHARGDEKLPAQKIRAGGIFKELKLKKDNSETSTLFLETLYYSIAG